MPGRTGDLPATRGDLLAALFAVAAGLLAAAGSPAPTGHRVTDAVLTGTAVALVVWIGSRAPWWAAGAAAGVALAIALDPLLIAVAATGLAAGLWAGTRPQPPRWLLAASLGVTCNVLAHAELAGRIGTSAAIAIVVGLGVFVLGTLRLPRRRRRLAWGGIAALAVAAGACTAGFAAGALESRHDLAAGLNTAELGVAALENGDYDGAARWFDEATGYLDAANDSLDTTWARLAAVVPVVAQHHEAVTSMSEAGADGLRAVSHALDEIDLDELRPQAGRFDLAALAELQDPLTDVRDALVRLRRTSDDVRSPWLVNRAAYELDDFAQSVDEHLPPIERSLEAIRMAPALLGSDGPRTYLVLFTTPSESRGLGGFVGSYGELTVDDGQLTLGAFGRAQHLDAAARAAGAVVHGHDEFVRQYGRFGFDADGSGAGVVGDAAFRNVAMSPDFPTVAEISADLYAQTTGKDVGGVIAMDPYVLTALLRYTGPVQLPSLGQEVTPDGALAFLLRDQYVAALDDEAREDGLAEAASQAFAALLAGGLPDPIALARDLGPLTSERRLLVWSADPDEQALFERVHINGEIPVPDGADGWSFTVANAGGNKIDSFLERHARYDATTDPGTGETTATLTIQLANTAPAEGLPPYVIGNRIGKPEGTSTLWVTVYSPLRLDGLTLGGTAVGVEPGTEAGWNTYRLMVDIPSGQTITLEASLSGTVERPDELVTWTQPMANDLHSL